MRSERLVVHVIKSTVLTNHSIFRVIFIGWGIKVEWSIGETRRENPNGSLTLLVSFFRSKILYKNRQQADKSILQVIIIALLYSRIFNNKKIFIISRPICRQTFLILFFPRKFALSQMQLDSLSVNLMLVHHRWGHVKLSLSDYIC